MTFSGANVVKNNTSGTTSGHLPPTKMPGRNQQWTYSIEPDRSLENPDFFALIIDYAG